MSGPTAPRGLCGQCRYVPDCAVRPTLNHPVTRCERFEPASHTAHEQNGANGLMGLCVACARRDRCTHPRPEGGVWHCNEYT